MKRAVITGLGIVSSIGNNQQEVLHLCVKDVQGSLSLRSLKIQGCAATYGATSNWIPLASLTAK